MNPQDKTTSIECPKCKNANILSSKIYLDRNTGLKTGSGSLIGGIVMLSIGVGLMILGFVNLSIPEAKPYIILGVGFILITTGLPVLFKFLKRKKESYYYYSCKDCSFKWQRLGGEGNSNAIKPFIDALESDETTEKINTLVVIVNFKDSRLIKPLRENINDPNNTVRKLASQALFSYTGSAIMEDALKASQDEEMEIKVLAYKALGKYKNDRAVNELINGLTSKKLDIRAAAISSLQKITGKKFLLDKKWVEWGQTWKKEKQFVTNE